MKMSVVKSELRHRDGILKLFFLFFFLVVPVRGRQVQSKYQYNLPKLPPGGKESNSVENHTIVIKAMCDLVTDYHADATKVERFSLAFAEERWLEDPCRKH